jgi:hypothetical protein
VSRSGTRTRASRKPVIVLIGEDRNDRQSLRVLLEAMCPETQGRLVELNRTVRLRGTTDKTLRDRVSLLGRLVRAKAALEEASVACVFVHEDLDRPADDGYSSTRARVQDALSAEFGTAHYVLAAWEVEAWLLLFPDALSALARGWSVPARYRSVDTGRLGDPKQILKREVSGPTRRYAESDAPGVLAKAVSLGLLHRPSGTNRSWSDMGAEAGTCCRTHLPRQREP